MPDGRLERHERRVVRRMPRGRQARWLVNLIHRIGGLKPILAYITFESRVVRRREARFARECEMLADQIEQARRPR